MKCTDEQRIITSFTRNDKVVNQNKYLINSNYHKNKQNDVGICQIEILQDTKKAVGYISKYIKKQFSSNNLDDIYLLDGWKREHKIKLVLTSRTPVPKYIYDQIFRRLDKEENYTVAVSEILASNNVYPDIKVGTKVASKKKLTIQEAVENCSKKEASKSQTEGRYFGTTQKAEKEEFNLVLFIGSAVTAVLIGAVFGWLAVRKKRQIH